MGYNEVEDYLIGRLKEMEITNPKIVRTPSGLFIAYPQPGSFETWQASCYKDDKEQYHFEYTKDSKLLY